MADLALGCDISVFIMCWLCCWLLFFVTDSMFIKTSPSLHQPFSNCSIVCFCFVAKVIPEGVVCSGSPPGLHWLSFMPAACLSSVAVELGSVHKLSVKPTVMLFWAFNGGAHLCLFFSWTKEKEHISMQLEALFSAEEVETWSFVSPGIEIFPCTGLSFLVWSPWGGAVK